MKSHKQEQFQTRTISNKKSCRHHSPSITVWLDCLPVSTICVVKNFTLYLKSIIYVSASVCSDDKVATGN